MKVNKCGSGEIYSFPMENIERIEYIEGRCHKETAKAAYSRLKKERGREPDFLINAELFNFRTRAAASDVVADGEVHRLTENFGMAFPGKKSAVFCYKNNVGAKDYVGSYPVLIRNGKCEESIPAGLGGNRGRTAIGVGNGRFYIAVVPDSAGISMQKLRTSLKSAGATDAINLDGGGSTQGYLVGKAYLSSRAVRGFVGVWLKQDLRRVSVRTSLNVRSGPSILHKRVGKLYNGDVVRVLETKLGFRRTPAGWVSALYLKG